VLLTGWQRYFAAFIAGLLSALAMAPTDFFPVLFITFPVFVWLLDGVFGDSAQGWAGKAKAAFLPGWWFGFGYFLAGLWWIGSAFIVEAVEFLWALPIAVVGVPALLALFWGGATVIDRLFWRDCWVRGFALAFVLFLYCLLLLSSGAAE